MNPKTSNSLVYGIAASFPGLPDEVRLPPDWDWLHRVKQWITNHLVAAVQSVPESQREAFVKKGEQKRLEDGVVDGSMGKSAEVIEQYLTLMRTLDPEFSIQRPRRQVRETPPE